MLTPNPETNELLATRVVALMLAKVGLFNQKVTALPIPAVPTMLGADRQEWAMAALKEELVEFEDACEAGDVVEAADALVDLVYFALGRLIEMGVPPLAVMDGVQEANMVKRRGELSKRPGSLGCDAVKPEGWTPPDHSWLLNLQLTDLRAFAEGAAQREAISPVWLELQALRESKGADYNDVPGGRDAYFPFGHFSYAHMLQTKNLRIQSLLSAMQKGRPVNHEGLYDTVRDLVNYGTYYCEAIRDGRVANVRGGES
jgi:phosphoribosyl-ATP pyrophosphohydrolase